MPGMDKPAGAAWVRPPAGPTVLEAKAERVKSMPTTWFPPAITRWATQMPLWAAGASSKAEAKPG